MGCVVDASFMLIRDLEKLPRKTLRERIYEEVVRLIVSGELPSGGWLDEKQVIDRLRVSRTPFREAIGTLAMGGLVEISLTAAFMCAAFLAMRRRTFTNYTSGLNVSRLSSRSRR